MTAMRINGFSGMDIDSMVKSMMTARREPLNKLNQQKTILEWQRDNYREINSKLFAFSTKMKNSDMSTAMNSYKSVVTGNIDAVKVEATASATMASMDLMVKELATQATVNTTGAGYGLKLSSTLGEAYKQTTGAAPIASTKFDLKINGEEFLFSNTTSISEVISAINGNTKAKATAKFDELSGKLTIVSKDYGAKAKLALDSSVDSEFFKAFKGKAVGTPDLVYGTNAKVNFNNEVDNTPAKNPVYREFESNTFLMNGVQITLLAQSDGTSSTIKTQTDSTKAMETIKNFINDYNELISNLNTKVNEERYRDFTPLTDEQKDEMTDNDIKNWEEKAKSGMLRNDGILKSATSALRMQISEVAGQLSAIGITTGQYYEGGKLYVDETKLKTALENNPQAVTDLFQGTASASSEGLFDKLQEVMDDAMTNLADKAGTSKFDGSLTSPFKSESSMGKQLKDYNKRIDDLQDRLTNLETRYYKQFTAMETAMSKLNSQSSSLLSSLGISTS